MVVSEIIQQLREKGWSDQGIGDALGVPRMTVYRWRVGRVPRPEEPTKEALMRLLRRAGPPKLRQKGKNHDPQRRTTPKINARTL